MVLRKLFVAVGKAAFIGAPLYFLINVPGKVAFVISIIVFLGLGGWTKLHSAMTVVIRDIRLLKEVFFLLPATKEFARHTKSISNQFTKTVAHNSDKIAILFEDQRWTFRQLDQYANKVANFFLEQGLKQGDTVAMFMENCPEHIGLWLGLSKIGVRASFINYNLREQPLLHCLTVCNHKAIVYNSSLKEAIKSVHQDLNNELQQKLFFISGTDDLISSSHSFDEGISSVSSDAPPPGYDDTLLYIYTSGTTGFPKAAKIPHVRYFRAAKGIRQLMKCTESDVVYCPMPLYHSTGSMVLTGQMIFGSTLVVRKKFSASHFWSDCIKYRCTIIVYLGEICRYLLAQPDRPTDTQHCVRLALGSGLQKQIWKKFQGRFQVPQILEFYGSTEGNVAFFNVTSKIGACGFHFKIIPNNTVILKIDPQTGEYIRDSNGHCIEAACNEPGEVAGRINNQNPFSGYINDSATNKKIIKNVFKDGDMYFRTGDLLRMDEEGYVYFCDRTGDTFRWKGENVSTTEVEAVIGRLYVGEIVVFGVAVPGAEGKAGMACIVGDEESVDVGGLADKLYQTLPAYAVPIFVRLIQQADITGTFKLQKTRLRNEGYDKDKVSDPLYILDKRKYVPLDEDKYQQLQNEELRF